MEHQFNKGMISKLEYEAKKPELTLPYISQQTCGNMSSGK